MEHSRRQTSCRAATFALVVLAASVAPCDAALRRAQSLAVDKYGLQKSQALLARSRGAVAGNAGQPAAPAPGPVVALAPAPMVAAPAPAMPAAPPPVPPPLPPPLEAPPTGMQPPAPAPSAPDSVDLCKEQCKKNKKMWEEVRKADTARLDAETERAVGQVRAEVSRLVGEVRERIDAEGALLKVRMENRLSSQINTQVAAFNGASQAQGAQALAHAKMEYKDLIAYNHALEIGVENRTVTAGFAAAKKAAEEQVKKDVDEEHLEQSSHKVLNALKSSEHAWEEARNTSYGASERVLKSWNNSDAVFRRDWTAVSEGMDGVQGAAEAVRRAARVVSWDSQDSRLAADAASQAKERALTVDRAVHEAQTQADAALTAAEKNAESIKLLEAHIGELEQGAGIAAEPSGSSYT